MRPSLVQAVIAVLTSPSMVRPATTVSINHVLHASSHYMYPYLVMAYSSQLIVEKCHGNDGKFSLYVRVPFTWFVPNGE